VSETPDPAPAGALPPAGEVSETSLEDTAAAAIAAAEAAPAAAAAPASGLDRPYVQIGIFSIEANATATADRLRGAGLLPTVLDQTSRGSRFWRVVVGPVPTAAERAQILQTVKGLGFTDAYAVRR
jgi:cell division septation protein DedD